MRLYSWGWGVYGQLGHGDVNGRLAPTVVAALDGASISQLACGYRHSMVVCSNLGARVVFAWGWGRHGQLGTGGWSDELLPQQVNGLPSSGSLTLRLGGKHSLAVCGDGRVYTWGRDDDGQLGHGAQGARCVPTRVDALRSSSLAFEVVDASCGWSHTALLVTFADPTRRGSPDAKARSRRRSSLSKEAGGGRHRPRIFVTGDFEGLFGQLLGTSIQFMLMQRLLGATCGFSPELLKTELMPGAASMYVSGHIFFAIQGTLLSRRTLQPLRF